MLLHKGLALAMLKLPQLENCRAILDESMNRLLTTLLVWLLMATLPLHAVAASVSMSCAPVQQQNITPPAVDHTDHMASSAAHDQYQYGEHVADAVSDHHSPDAEANKPSHSSCSACSAFCIGAVAPPSSSLPLPAFDGSEAVIIAAADPVTGFIPDGLHRPPRQ